MSAILSLTAGDEIALICTGSVCETKQDPLNASEYLNKHYGLKPQFRCDTYIPLSARERAEILLDYMLSKRIKAIWSLRGGEGSADLIPYLEPRANIIRQCQPKFLLGFSDFTPILVYFAQRFNWPVLHTLGARQLHRRMVDYASEVTTLDWILCKQKKLQINHLQPLNQPAMQIGVVTGEVIGGNLSLIHASLKDTWEVCPRDKILLLEEVNEQPYQISRTLKHLHRIEFFSQAKAVLIAGCDFSMLNAQEAACSKVKMLSALASVARDINVPILYTDSVGHGMKNFPIPYYLPGELTLGSQACLQFNQ